MTEGKKGKLMVIGSGPIVIGQAAEFDFSGSQACRSLREEGYETVLVNSNPATIQTDLEMADIVYIEPLTVETIAKIIEKEKVEGVLSGMGGQTALNLCSELAEKGYLERLNCRLCLFGPSSTGSFLVGCADDGPSLDAELAFEVGQVVEVVLRFLDRWRRHLAEKVGFGDKVPTLRLAQDVRLLRGVDLSVKELPADTPIDPPV